MPTDLPSDPPAHQTSDLPAADLLATLEPLAGGYSGRTFLGRVADQSVVVRIYPPGQGSPEVDAAVLSLVRGLLPVARVVDVHRADAGTDRPGLLLTELLPGVRGDLLLPELAPADRVVVGERLGGLLADLAGMPTVRGGRFADAELRIQPWGAPYDDGLPALLEASEPDLAHLRVEELAGLRELVVDAQALLDTVERTCLVHSDVNPKNLLLDPDSLQVTGLVDWEFAHAGHPFTDLGNLLRFERGPDAAAFVDAVVASYVDRRGGDPGTTLALARAADLWALIDLATRRHANPVAAEADRLLRSLATGRPAC